MLIIQIKSNIMQNNTDNRQYLQHQGQQHQINSHYQENRTNSKESNQCCSRPGTEIIQNPIISINNSNQDNKVRAPLVESSIMTKVQISKNSLRQSLPVTNVTQPANTQSYANSNQHQILHVNPQQAGYSSLLHQNQQYIDVQSHRMNQNWSNMPATTQARMQQSNAPAYFQNNQLNVNRGIFVQQNHPVVSVTPPKINIHFNQSNSQRPRSLENNHLSQQQFHTYNVVNAPQQQYQNQSQQVLIQQQLPMMHNQQRQLHQVVSIQRRNFPQLQESMIYRQQNKIQMPTIVREQRNALNVQPVLVYNSQQHINNINPLPLPQQIQHHMNQQQQGSIVNQQEVHHHENAHVNFIFKQTNRNRIIEPPRVIEHQIVHPQQTIVVNQQFTIWQQRYFTIFTKFDYFYKQIEVIRQEYAYIQRTILKMEESSQQIDNLKERSLKLQQLINKTQQQLTEIIHMNKDIQAQTINWKGKYDDIIKEIATLRQHNERTIVQLKTQLKGLSDNFSQLQVNYQSLLVQNQNLKSNQGRLKLQIQTINRQLTQKNSNKQGNLDERQIFKEQNVKLRQQIQRLNKFIVSSKTQVQSNVITVSNSKNEEIIHKNKQIQLLKKYAAEQDHQIEQLNQVITQLNYQISHNSKQNQSNKQVQPDYSAFQREISSLQEELNAYINLTEQLKRENIHLHEEFGSKNNLKMNAYEVQLAKLQGQNLKNLALLQERANFIEILSKNGNMNNTLNQKSVKESQISNSSRQRLDTSDFQAEIRLLKNEIKVKEETHDNEIKIFHSKTQELLENIKTNNNERQLSVKTLHEKICILESDINRKDGTIRNLRDRILQLQEQNKLKDLYKKDDGRKVSDSSSFEKINQQYMLLKRQLNDKINRIEQFQAQITEYKRISNQYEDSLTVKKHQVNTLRRQLQQKSQFGEELTKLTEQLSRKNIEIIDLKNKTFELQKANNHNELLKYENASLSENIKKKQNDLSESSDKIYSLQKRIRDLQVSKESNYKMVQVQQEYALLSNANSKKDQEIIKLRQSNQLLQSNIDSLQIQIENVKKKLSSGERLSEVEISEFKSKISRLELNTVEYQRKISGLQDIRVILAEQINTLTNQLHLKIENLHKFQIEIKQERSRTKAFEMETQSHDIQISQLRNKLRQAQKKYQSLVKEHDNEFQKKKELTNTKKAEFFNLNNKYIELENYCKSKDTKIKELQKTIESLNSKINNVDHNMDEIKYLKDKIVQYEFKINHHSSLGYRHALLRNSDIEPNQVFERKVIYQLKLEIQSLKKQLGFSPSKDNKEDYQKHIPEKDTIYVKQRLNDFNHRLQSIIGEESHGNLQINDERIKKFQKDKKELIERHRQEIAQLHIKIMELQSNGAIVPRRNYSVEQIYTQQIQFYRQKNSELEYRVENHIRVNKQLKESLQELLKNHNGQYSVIFYKEQITKLNEVIINLQKQLKKSNDESKKLKEELSRVNTKSLEMTLLQYENKISDLSRRISQLTSELSISQKQRLSRQQEYEESQTQIKKLKNLIDELKLAKEEIQNILKMKENLYRDQLAKVSNKLQINLSEIERLNEMMSKKQGKDSDELKNAKLRIAELLEENKKLKYRLEELILIQERFKRQKGKFQKTISQLQVQISRFRQWHESSIKKQKVYEVQIHSLRQTIMVLQSKIRNLQNNNEGFSMRENQQAQEIIKLLGHIKLFQIQIQKVNQFAQKKISEKDVEINRLTMIINELNDELLRNQEQINHLKMISFKNNQVAQEIFNLREEINALRATLAVKSSEIEVKSREINDLQYKLRTSEQQWRETKKSYDIKISQLNSTIVSLQGQLSDLKKRNDSSLSDTNFNILSLQQQLRQLRRSSDEEIIQLKSTIMSLQLQIRQLCLYQQEFNTLRDNFFNLQNRYKELNMTLQRKQVQIRELMSAQTDVRTLRERIITLESQSKQVNQRYTVLVSQMRNKQSHIFELQAYIRSLQEKIQKLMAGNQSNDQLVKIINSSKYTVQFLRSLLIEIETLLGQEEREERFNSKVAVIIEEQINAGLVECERWLELV